MRCCWRPAPVAENTRTLEDAIAAEVAAITDEMHRIDQRLAALNWGPALAHRTGGESWADFCFGRPVEQDDGGQVAREVLRHKRLSLQHQLERLRQRLVGQGSSERRGRWG